MTGVVLLLGGLVMMEVVVGVLGALVLMGVVMAVMDALVVVARAGAAVVVGGVVTE